MHKLSALALLLLLVSTASAALAQLQRPTFEPQSASGRPPAAVAAAAGKHGGSGGGVVVIPPGFPKDSSLAGKPCTYTPGLVDSQYDNLTACNDARLSTGQQAACLKCIGIKRREACLKTPAALFWSADSESCTWVGEQPKQRHALAAAVKTTEIRYSLGINTPSYMVISLDSSTCSVDVQVEVTNPASQQVFPTALFEWSIEGEDVLPGLQPQLSCTLRQGNRVCQGTINRPAYLKSGTKLFLNRRIWTNRLAAVKEWRKTNDTCLSASSENGTCAALPEPYKFDFDLKLVEKPCKPRSAPQSKAAHVLQIPLADVGTVMFPGGESFDVIHSHGVYLKGAGTVQWRVRVPRSQKGSISPVFVGLTGPGFEPCSLSSDKKFHICDFSAAANATLPGTACTGLVCQGSYTFKGGAPTGTHLAVAFPKYTANRAAPWIVNAKETPPQTVEISVVAAP